MENKELGLGLAQEILARIAARVDGSVRELEGGLTKVRASEPVPIAAYPRRGRGDAGPDQAFEKGKLRPVAAVDNGRNRNPFPGFGRRAHWRAPDRPNYRPQANRHVFSAGK